MVNRPKPKLTDQSNDQAEQANSQRPQNDEAEVSQAGPSIPPPSTRHPRSRKHKQATLHGPLRRSIRVCPNKPSAFDRFSYDIQRWMISLFLSNLDMAKQIQLRGVCHLWKGEVAHNCKMVKALVLFLQPDPSVAANQMPSAESIKRSTYSDLLNWDKKDHGITITPSQVKVLIISESHWNSDTIESIGQLFRNIKHLSIYDNTVGGAPPDIDKFSALWSLLPKVEALFLDIKSPITRDDFLARLFGTIEQHLAPLEALSLLIETDIVFPRLPPENIVKTTRFMRNFVLSCSVANLSEIIQMVGRDLHTGPKKLLPIRELKIDVVGIREEQVAPMFARNPALGQVTWLILNDVTNLKVVSAFLEHSRALETLWLIKQRESTICFGNELFTAVSKLDHLRKMMLFRFDIFDFGTIYKAQRATQISELLIAQYGLFENVLAEWRKNNDALLDQNGALRSVDTFYPALGESAEAIVRPFVANVARLFPNLIVFTLITNSTLVDQMVFRRWCKEEFKCVKRYGISTLLNRD